MAKARITEEAREDLENIYFELSEYSSSYAQDWIDDFFHQVEVIEKFPYLGKVSPTIALKPLRKINVGKYTVYYVVVMEEIWVLGIKYSGFK
ncbi:MAG: type II toxin-antitoxin system RelE/ParE family toxin [Runella sp.]